MSNLDVNFFVGTPLHNLAAQCNKAFRDGQHIKGWVTDYTNQKPVNFIKIDMNIYEFIQRMINSVSDLKDQFSIGQAEVFGNYLMQRKREYNIARATVIATNDYIGRIILENAGLLSTFISYLHWGPVGIDIPSMFNRIDNLIKKTKLPASKGGKTATALKEISRLMQTVTRQTTPLLENVDPIDGFTKALYWLRCCQAADKVLASKYKLPSILEKPNATTLKWSLRHGREMQSYLNTMIKEIKLKGRVRIDTPYPGDVDQLLGEVHARALYTAGPNLTVKFTVDKDQKIQLQTVVLPPELIPTLKEK